MSCAKHPMYFTWLVLNSITMLNISVPSHVNIWLEAFHFLHMQRMIMDTHDYLRISISIIYLWISIIQLWISVIWNINFWRQSCISIIQLRLSIIQNYCIHNRIIVSITELWISIIFNCRSVMWMHGKPKAIDYGYMINHEHPWFNCRYP